MNDSTHLETLQDYYAHHHVLPSFSTISELTGLRSKSSVSALVNRLKIAGYLDTSPGNRLKPGKLFFSRTIVDSVRAGLPQPANDYTQDSFTIDDFLIEKPAKTVLVRVKGDSMIEANICEGDIVVVEKRSFANKEDMVIAIIDDEFTLKYLDKDEEGLFLRPANHLYKIIRPVTSFEIFGVVVGLIRKY